MMTFHERAHLRATTVLSVLSTDDWLTTTQVILRAQEARPDLDITANLVSRVLKYHVLGCLVQRRPSWRRAEYRRAA